MAAKGWTAIHSTCEIESFTAALLCLIQQFGCEIAVTGSLIFMIRNPNSQIYDECNCKTHSAKVLALPQDQQDHDTPQHASEFEVCFQVVE